MPSVMGVWIFSGITQCRRTVFQLILSSEGVMNVDHLRGHQDHVLIFFVIFSLILICHLSGQEAFFVRSLPQDPSLICITGCICIYVIASLHLLQFTF